MFITYTERVPRQAMEWRPDGKRGRGRPRMTWYNTVEKDLSSIGLSWDMAAQLTKDRQACMEKLYCPMCSAQDGLRRIINPE